MSQEELVKTVQKWETIKTGISAVISTILGIIFVVIGFWLIFRKDDYTSSATGTIKTANCKQTYKGGITCDLTVTFQANGKSLDGQTMVSGKTYSPGESISIRYNPNDPTKITTVSKQTMPVVGFILILIGLLVVSAHWIYFYLVKRNPKFAIFSAIVD